MGLNFQFFLKLNSLWLQVTGIKKKFVSLVDVRLGPIYVYMWWGDLGKGAALQCQPT